MYKYTLHKHSTPTNAQLSNMNTRPITATKLQTSPWNPYWCYRIRFSPRPSQLIGLSPDDRDLNLVSTHSTNKEVDWITRHVDSSALKYL